MLPFLILLQSLVFVKSQDYEPKLTWYSRDTNINLIAPNNLAKSKAENRRVAIVLDGKICLHKQAENLSLKVSVTLFSLLLSMLYLVILENMYTRRTLTSKKK